MCTNFGRERHENAFSQVVNLVGGSLPKFVHAFGMSISQRTQNAGATWEDGGEGCRAPEICARSKAKGLLVGKGNRPAGQGSPPRGLSGGRYRHPGFYLWRSMASARIFSASALSPQPEPVTSLLGSRSL